MHDPISSDHPAFADARMVASQLAEQVDAGLLGSEAAEILRDVQRLLGSIAGDTCPVLQGQRTLFFDISDLLGYFPYNRLPTGIQRVQISTILNLMDAANGWTITPCRFVEKANEWREVPAILFRSLANLSLAEGDADAADWRSEYRRLDSATMVRPALVFPQDACLVNLGTSWWLPDYFSSIRQAKMISGIRYIPLIHDMIPAMMPEFCNLELVQEFIDWIVGVLQHADFFLAVSDSTKRDLIALAAGLGVVLPDDRVAVVPLASELNHVGPTDAWTRVPLQRWGLQPGRYVMFVSTLEARKNQFGAFDAWQTLLATHSPDQVPTLVCVGKRGFQSDLVLSRLDMNPALRTRVLLLDKVNDAELEALYRQCLFTVYPSLYEGWGLPVTESLAYGKVPVTSDNSSLPQAGGGFSVLFESGSQAGFVAALERMIFDDAFRKDKEAAIASGFSTRSWADVAADVERAVASVHDNRGNLREPWSLPLAQPGYYPLARNRETGVRRGIGSAELFRKGGSGWWRLEDFGAWTRASGGELMMRLAPTVRNIAIELHGLPGRPSRYVVSAGDGVILAEGGLLAKAERWLILDVGDHLVGDTLTLRISSLETEIIVDELTEKEREVGVGVGGFYVFDPDLPRARIDFVEAVALGSLIDRKVDVLA